MKKLKYILILLVLTGCNKESDTPVKPNADIATAKTQFELADKQIATYLDKLDDPKTEPKVRVQILCSDYPTTYKTKYMPALMELQPKDYTEQKLLKDLDSALNYYKNQAQIVCE